MKQFLLLAAFICCVEISAAQQIKNVTVIPVGKGWANNSVNTVAFRKNSLVSYKEFQYIAYYDSAGFVVVGKRKLRNKNWQLITTSFKGNVADAHNSISIMVDGDGFLHMAWNHHGNALHYTKSVKAGSLQFIGEIAMTGSLESNITYPEFYKLPNGNLLFFYRDGASGQGNLVINSYDIVSRKWIQLHHNLIDGQHQRNAYWQACTDKQGTIHISWVWRENADVASNHDLCYARSIDGGKTWERSTGEKYLLPVTAANAEYICRIPQGSELINQTSMTTDDDGHPFIASYWKDKNDIAPQYHMVYYSEGKWLVQNTGFRKTNFSLSGMGTKRIPIARPQIIAWTKNRTQHAAIICRDEERANKFSIAISNAISLNKWVLKDITIHSVGQSEPGYDTELWKQKKKLQLFVQYTEQKDSEGKAAIPPQLVQVVECNVVK